MITSTVNAASYGAPQLPSIAPGSIATIFGSNLATDTVAATSTPLPNQLGGTTVTVDGVRAPLFYVSPTQINFQVSWRYQQSISDVSVNTTLVVTSAAGGAILSHWESTLLGQVSLLQMVRAAGRRPS